MRTTKGIVINSNGTMEHKTFTALKDYQEGVKGLIEAVRLYNYSGEEVACMYVNEEGIMLSMPMNPYAGALSFMLGNTPHLCGNAIIVGKADDEGYDTDIPEWLAGFIKETCPEQLELGV